MAHFEFKLPDIGEGVTEGEVVAWHVREGDKVVEDQLMVEVMTDKATVTIGAPRAGQIDQLKAEVGHIVHVGDVLVVIRTGNGSRAHAQAPAATAVGDIRESLPGTSYFAGTRAAVEPQPQATSATATGVAAVPPTPAHYDERPLATPATRKLARDLRVDLRRVPPTGPGGRVTQEDVRGASAGMPSGAAPSGAEPLPPAQPAQPVLKPAAPTPSAPRTDAVEQRLPFVGLRRKIAERMSESKNTAAHFAFVEECDAGRLLELRARLRPEAQARGITLSFLPFIIKATLLALRKHPMLNCQLDRERNELVLRDHCHMGIAAATEQGLVVPVIHHAERLSLMELAAEVERLGTAAREGTLQVSELTGSTFTITSLGKQAGHFAIPIINYPNVGILGVHRIKERPVVRDGKIVVGNIMLLSLSLDHRIVDGHVGAAFAYDVIAYLEDPASMLLDL